MRRDLFALRETHEDNQSFGSSHLAPVDLRNVVAGNKSHHRRVIAMSKRHARVCRYAKRGSNSGHDFEWNSGVRQSFRFFAAAAEDEGISALQPDHVEAAPSAIDQQRANFLLRRGMIGSLFADIDPFSVFRRILEQIGIRQVIVKDAVGAFEQTPAF